MMGVAVQVDYAHPEAKAPSDSGTEDAIRELCLARELYHGVRPMLATSGGSLMMLSTPYGKRGVLHQGCTGEAGWERHKVSASECPRITEEFLEEERRTLPVRIYRQEYFNSFEETQDQVFAHEDVMAALDETVQPLF